MIIVQWVTQKSDAAEQQPAVVIYIAAVVLTVYGPQSVVAAMHFYTLKVKEPRSIFLGAEVHFTQV